MKERDKDVTDDEAESDDETEKKDKEVCTQVYVEYKLIR